MSQSKDARNKKKSESRFPGAAAWALVRVWMGVFFVFAGLAQMPSLLNASVLSSVTQSVGLEPFQAISLGGFMPILQVVIGFLLLVGVFTPYAALVGLIITAWALYPAGLDLTATGSTVVVCMLALILAKAGRHFGLDALLHKRVHLPLL